MKKNLILALSLVPLSLVAADEKILDIRPDAAKGQDAPTAVEWQEKNAQALAAAVTPQALAAIVADAAKADALCAAVKPNYATDALKAHQLAAVTQYVMRPGAAAGCAAERRLWVGALVKAARASADVSVRQFFLDQMRWCACEKCIPTVYEIAGTDAKLKPFADLIARELKGRK